MTALRQTPLIDRHLALGAKCADFGGWLMPIEYAGVVAEHHAVRTDVGVFDVSHMGKVRVHGPGAADFLNGVLAGDLDRIGPGRAQYSMLLNESGGVVDDLIVYRWSDDELFAIPNAANARRVVAALQAAAPAGVGVDDKHDDVGILAVQGPRSAAVVDALGFPSDLAYMTMQEAAFAGERIIVCRTGYTGEHGYELVIPAAALGAAWDAVCSAGASPVGLGARDTLRTEMGYPLHGQDISPQISPVEAGLSWAIGWDKPAFAGRDAAVAQRAAGPARRLRGLRAIDRGIPRCHMAVYASSSSDPLSGPVVGEVTSGTFSPTLKTGIGLALLSTDVAVGDEVVVDVRGRASRFEVVTPPFVSADPRA